MRNDKLFLSFIKKNRVVIIYLAASLFLISSVFYVCSLPFYAVGYALMLCGALGIIMAFVCFIKYVTKVKNLERQRDRVLYELNGLPEATELSEGLYQELLIALSTEKTRMDSKVSSVQKELYDYYTLWLHQIKTPIAAMRLLLQTVEGEQNVPLKLELFKIEQYAQMALQYVRIEDMNQDLVLNWYSLDEIIKSAVRKYSTMFILKNISLDFEEIHEKVLTDAKWLEFVIEQLLSNALKYTMEGKIHIYYDTENKSLVIEDTGIGISQEDLPKVFERGFTGYNGRFNRKSTGIGLYLCKKIMNNLAHPFKITSKIGEGTKVMLFLERKELNIDRF